MVQLRSNWWHAVVGILVPPAGLFMLWRRPWGIARKLAASLALVGVSLAYLVFVFGLRVELAGNGLTPIFRFGSAERHYQELDKNRAEAAAIPKPEEAIALASGTSLANAPETQRAPAAVQAASSAEMNLSWSGFRGPLRDGHYRGGPILTQWPERGLELVWKQPIGGGYASFAAGEGLIYTIEQRREQEVVAAYDLITGREIWTHSYPALFQESMGGDGPRATPTYYDGVLYSLGATGELRALEARSGKVIWAKNILSEAGAENLTWGMSGSPLVVDGKVVVQPGGRRGQSVVAYDCKSGRKVWASLDDKQAYTSPLLATLAGHRQIVTVTAERAVGLAVEDGRLLWDYPWKTQYDVNSAQPVVVGDNRLILSSGYGHGAALLEIRREGNNLRAHRIWENTRMKNRFNSSVLHEGHIYGLDEGILACVRVDDGELRWKGGRYGYGQLLLAGEHLIIISERGELVLVKASPQAHQEIARFQAIEGKTWNVPAIERGYLLVRNAEQMACFRLQVQRADLAGQ